MIAGGALIDEPDNSGFTPLHLAASGGYPDVVETLIASGSRVNSKTNDGQTPLHCAASRDRPQIVELLIANGAEVNAQSNGGTPLHNAARKGCNNAAATLIDNGADIEARNTSDKTPLHEAAIESFFPMVELLIVKGANIHARSGFLGTTPLGFAVSPEPRVDSSRTDTHTIEILKRSGAKSLRYWWANWVLAVYGFTREWQTANCKVGNAHPINGTERLHSSR